MASSDRIINDHLNAFANTDVYVEGSGDGPLSGLTFAAKDIFDVEGHVTGAGNPDWKRSHGPAERTAWTVQALIDAGATLVGKTHTDELTRGILGQNPHFGTPTNPNAPGRVPGGSSSGSASAVAGGLVDFALGSDTGGSVRVPASFCGLYGIRPTHGRVSLDGVLPQASRFDTVGWFARDAETFARVGGVLLQTQKSLDKPTSLVIAEDAFELVEDDVRTVLDRVMQLAVGLVGASETARLSPSGLQYWMNHQRMLQGREAWDTMKDWINELNPRFAVDVSLRYFNGMTTTDEQVKESRAVQAEVVERIDNLLSGNKVICLPTATSVAPMLDRSLEDRQGVRSLLGHLMCTGGMTGCPQVTIPSATSDGLPVGFSLLGARGTDEMLISIAQELAEEL